MRSSFVLWLMRRKGEVGSGLSIVWDRVEVWVGLSHGCVRCVESEGLGTSEGGRGGDCGRRSRDEC